jgi:hypothetical protein
MPIVLVAFDAGPLFVGLIVMGIMLGISIGVLVVFGLVLGAIVGIPAKLIVGENPVAWMKPPAPRPPRRRPQG